MNLIEAIKEKYLEDRERIKALKARHAEELRELETFQSRREAALLEQAGVESFEFMTDLYVNGRDGKAEAEKKKESVAMDQAKIEAWLLKMLNQIGDSVKTSAGTVYKTRKESVTCADFEMFVKENMLKDAARAVASDLGCDMDDLELLTLIETDILSNMHLELLTKAVRKESILELMGEASKDGSRPNSPPAGVNYVAVQSVGVRRSK